MKIKEISKFKLKKCKGIKKYNVIIYLLLSWLYYSTLVVSMTNELSIIYENVFPNHFSWIRFCEGALWCMISLFMIKNNKSSISFFLLFTFFVQMIPLSAIYTVCGGSWIYFHTCYLGFLICVCLSQHIKKNGGKLIKEISREWIYVILAVSLIIVLVHIYSNNGLPSLIALDIYKVYELRSSGDFYINKYVGYLFNICNYVMLPILLTKSILKKKYIISVGYILIIVLLYLYSGHKVILFSIPLVLGALYLANKNDTNSHFMYLGTIGMTVLSLCGVFCEQENAVYKIFSLIIRRVILLPARIKFCYYDYFTSHPKYGLYGIFPRLFVDVESEYEGVVIGNVIGELYFEQDTNSSTGFLGEAVMHFGLPGVIVGWIIIAIILREFDKVEKLEGKHFVIGAFSMFIYFLNDGSLFGSLVAGPAMAVILICIYINFSKKGKRRYRYRRRSVSEDSISHSR